MGRYAHTLAWSEVRSLLLKCAQLGAGPYRLHIVPPATIRLPRRASSHREYCRRDFRCFNVNSVGEAACVENKAK